MMWECFYVNLPFIYLLWWSFYLKIGPFFLNWIILIIEFWNFLIYSRYRVLSYIYILQEFSPVYGLSLYFVNSVSKYFNFNEFKYLPTFCFMDHAFWYHILKYFYLIQSQKHFLLFSSRSSIVLSLVIPMHIVFFWHSYIHNIKHTHTHKMLCHLIQ